MQSLQLAQHGGFFHLTVAELPAVCVQIEAQVRLVDRSGISSSSIPFLKIEHSDDDSTNNWWNEHANKESDCPHIGSIHFPSSPIKIDPAPTE